jgi:hypothetical protein
MYMIIRLFCLFFFCYLFHPASAPAQVAKNTENRTMTEDEALSVLRSRATSSLDLGFVTVGRVEATSTTRHTAQESLDEAQSNHLGLYGKGIFVNLMRAGGFVILEFDAKSDAATRLHLVTLDEVGETIVQSQNVDGNLSRSDALTIIARSEKLSDAFFVSPGSQPTELARKFGGASVANVGIPDGQGYFAIPERLSKLTTQPDELLDLESLSAAVQLWPVRYALSLPIYSANPSIALKSAHQKFKEIIDEFLRRNSKSPDFIYHLSDLDSIDTREELAARLWWLKEIVSFLDTQCPCQLDSTTYKANVSISIIPLNLGVMNQNSDRSYAVMSAPGLITIWSRAENGDFVLKGLSEGE